MTITITSSTVFDSGFGFTTWRFGVSAIDAAIIQSNPNALNVNFNGVLKNINAMYIAAGATQPPFGLLWNIAYLTVGVPSAGWYVAILPTTGFGNITDWLNFDGPYNPLVTGVTESITVSQAPQALQPVYNPITYVVYSPKFAENGFRYLATVKTGAETLGTYKMVPLSDGSGYIDIQKILSNQVSYDWFNTQPSDCPDNFNSYIDYNVEFGQEYTTNWPYTNLVSYTANTFYSGYTVLNQVDPSILHTYVLGDQITIATTTTGTTANVSGLHQVVAVPSSTQVVIDIPYPGTGATVGVSGTTVYSDSRKVGFFNLITASGTTAFNGALSWPDYKAWIGSDYTMPIVSGTTDLKYLSSIQPYTGTSDEQKYFLTDFQDIWLNYFTENMSVDCRTVFSSDIDGPYAIAPDPSSSLITKTYFSIDYLINSINFNPNLKYIDVYLERQSNAEKLTKTYRFWRDTRCVIEEIQIAFMDLMGSILSIPFTLRVTENIKIDREMYKQAITYPSNTQIDLRDRGTTINNVKVEQTFDLNTNWMNDAQMSLYKEMIASPYTWVKFGDGEYQSCIITETGLEVTQQKNKKLFKKSCSIKMANNNPQNI